MARNTENMQKLMELRERLSGEIGRHQQAIEALKNQLIGVDQAIKTLGPDLGAAPRRNVKKTVMEVIQEAGKAGITASEAVDRAAAKGRTLERPSVSSLLSRFKREGALTFDGERYYSAASQAPETPFKIVKSGG